MVMDFAPLLRKGQPVCRLGLGTWALGGGNDWGPVSAQAAQDTVAAALQAGINWVDTAPVYANGEVEALLGRMLKGRRQEVLLATKCGIVVKNGRPDHDLRPDTIYAQCHASLRHLQTDYIDLYQIHWPDPHLPLEQALPALQRLKEQGKIRAIGLCNVHASQLCRACCAVAVDCVQNPLSLLKSKQAEVLAVCREQQIPFCAYGALGGGILSGKYHKPPNFRRCDARRYFYKYYFGAGFDGAQPAVERVREVAAQKKAPPSAVALAWVLAQAGVSGVLAGAKSPRQVAENVQAARLCLTEEEKGYLQASLPADPQQGA